jgi:hypothetical protein
VLLETPLRAERPTFSAVEGGRADENAMPRPEAITRFAAPLDQGKP